MGVVWVAIHFTTSGPPCEETKALGSPYRVAEAMKKDDMCAQQQRHPRSRISDMDMAEETESWERAAERGNHLQWREVM